MAIMCTYYALTLVVIGLINLLVSGTTTAKRGIAGIATFLASVFFLIYTVAAITQGPVESMSRLFTWRLPFAGLATGVDTLSSFFLVPLLVLSAVGALYGSRYFDGHDESPYHWLLYALLVSGMVLVLCARNAVFFLLAWEVMSLSSFFLVITDHKKEQSLYAGWLYFVTAHIGTVFLLLLFFMLASSSGSFDFESWENSAISPVRANLIFITALIAFGMKAGFIPFHVWLPHAHPAAPSHVSALMSGIMIKMGIYGILRILPYITPYHAWWGITLLFLGALSGILGVLYAIGQHDIKRLLAYHSVENIGIILLGMGIGFIGNVYVLENIDLVVFTGALLHV